MSNIGLMTISVLLFIISLYFYKKPDKYIFTVFPYFIMAFSSFLLFIAYGISDYFTGNGIDEAAIYHLKYGLGGAGFLEYKGLIIISITLLTLGSSLFFWFLYKKKNISKKKNNIISYSLLLFSLFMNPASIDIYKAINVDYSVSDDFYKYYKKPYITPITENKKNLVFIYAEGLELTYFNQSIFPKLIKGLRELEKRSTYFTNIFQVPGNRFTIAGIVNSQLGISLATPSFENSMSGMDQYLPSAVGLGDLLHDESYYLSFIGGADLTFAGKGKFFKTHGFDEILGRDELLPKLKDKTYLNGWGLYDDTLLNIVFDRFLELSKEKKNFGLFTLTLDTHHPNGHVSKSCNNLKYKDGSNPILNAVACSDYLISNFINKIINSPYAHKTIIVLVSDHLALKNSAHDILESKIKINDKKVKIKRRNLFMIIDPNVKHYTRIKVEASSLDIAATILPFIGYKGEIGLGRNILQDIKPGDSIKKYVKENKTEWIKAYNERKYILNNIKNWKGAVIKFWDFPKIKDTLLIDIKKKRVKLDNRNFKIPILIEMNEQLKSTLKFQFDINKKKQTLVEQLYSIDKNKSFILIDRGINVKEINNQFDGEGFYLIAGKGKRYTRMMKLDKNITFTVKEIHQLIKEK